MTPHPAGSAVIDGRYERHHTVALEALARKLGLAVAIAEDYDSLMGRIAAEVRKRGWPMPTKASWERSWRWAKVGLGGCALPAKVARAQAWRAAMSTESVAHVTVDDCLLPDDGGWFMARCSCGFQAGVFPDLETMVDALMEHAWFMGEMVGRKGPQR